MGLRNHIKTPDSDRQLSRTTGFLYYVYLKLGDLETTIKDVRELMSQSKPWFDSDTEKPLMPRLKSQDPQ